MSDIRTQFFLLSKDIVHSITNWHFWVTLAWNDVLKQYRRSLVGPLWISLNTAIFISSFGYLGAQLFKFKVETYIPYFCSGQIIFGLISNWLTEGCATYVAAEGFLKQSSYSKLSFVLRVVFRNLLMFSHNLAVMIGVLLFFDQLHNIQWINFIMGLSMVTLVGCFLVAIIALVATRFRDVPMIVASAMQVLFFVTPVIWRSDQLNNDLRDFILYNPLATLIDIVRNPLLGHPVSTELWIASGVIFLILVPIFWVAYLLGRRRIVYWL